MGNAFNCTPKRTPGYVCMVSARRRRAPGKMAAAAAKVAIDSSASLRVFLLMRCSIAPAPSGKNAGARVYSEVLEHRAGFEPANTGFADPRVGRFATGAHRAGVL
jgi:hypothetical protein